MTTEEMREEISICDKKKPFLFVSYKREDADKVFPCVLELQQKGVNLWIDKEMNDEVGYSWQKPAFETIFEMKCVGILFFTSKQSLRSIPILAELEYSQLENVKKRHRKNFNIICFDTDRIVQSYGSVSAYIEDEGDEEKKGPKTILGDTKISPDKLPNMFPTKYFANWNEQKREAYFALLKTEFEVADQIMKLAKIDKETTILAKSVGEIAATFQKMIGSSKPEASKSTEESKTDGQAVRTEPAEEAAHLQGRTSEIAAVDRMREASMPYIGPIYHISGRKYDAYFILNGDQTFTVMKGSRIAQEWRTYSSRALIQRAEKIVDGNGILQADITINAQSAAAKFIKGISTNGSEILLEKNLFQKAGGPTVPSPVPPQPIRQEEVIPDPTSHFGDDPKVENWVMRETKMKLSEMIDCGMVSVGDPVYVKNRMSEEGVLRGGNIVSYKGRDFSLNKYVTEVLGPGSRNAYDYVVHKQTGKLLTQLRDESM